MRHFLQLLPLIALGLLTGCIEPGADVFLSSPRPPVVGPNGPAPDHDAYQCSNSTGSSCQGPRARIWLPEWMATAMAARGNKVAFTAYPTLPKGGANFAAPLQAGQIDLTTGKLDWLFPLGNNTDDYYSTYDMAMAPNGDVVFAAQGYGTTLVGEGGYQFDGFLAIFNALGAKRFAKRLEIWDAPPPPDNRPRFVSASIIADDVIRVRTSFYVTLPNLATYSAVHLFSFTPDGTQTYRKEVPQVPEVYNTYTWPVFDGSCWIWHPPGPMYRYSKEGDVLDTMEVPNWMNVQGFSPMGVTFGLINFTTKGITNELHRFDLGMPLMPLFNEATFPQFAAASIKHTLGLERAYFYEMGIGNLTHRFATIDANGHRGAVTTVKGVSHQFTLYDDGTGIFIRINDQGTEFIAQSL